MKKLFLFGLALVFSTSSCNTARLLLSELSEPSEAEVILALQEMLNSNVLKTVVKLKQINEQGAAALLPKEIQPVLGMLKKLGVSEDIDKVEQKIVAISAEAVAESGVILKESVKGLKFGDAVAVVLGGKNAATHVLKKAMYTTVKKRYNHKIAAELEKTGNIDEYWGMASAAYNILAKEKVNSSLPDFLAERAVDALFLGVGAEEEKVRTDPASIGKAVVEKVFILQKSITLIR